MKRATAVLTLALVAAAFAATPASAQITIAKTENLEVYFGVNTVGTAQALDQENAFDSKGASFGKLDPGFQTAWGDLKFGANYGPNKDIEMYFDIYLASRPHPSQTYGHEGYLLIHNLPDPIAVPGINRIFKYVDLKVGAFEIDYGDQWLHRSNNANVQRNPLIGNFVLDPNSTEVGGEIRTKANLPWGALVGVSSGTTTENFVEGRPFGYHAKVWANPISNIRASGSIYRVDHSDTAPRSAGGTGSTMFTGNRSGGRYGGVFGGGQGPGDVFTNTGKDVTAWEGALTFNFKPVEVFFDYGNVTDSDLNGNQAGTPEESWNYYAAQGKYNFTDRFYGAARYSTAIADKVNNVSSDGKVERMQIGGGYWLNKYFLAKLEYVNEEFSGFEQGILINNVQAWKDPGFNGFLMEVSFAF